MGYSALKQHSEKKKHKGFSSTLQKVRDKEKVEEADKPKCTDSQEVLQDFFLLSQVLVPLKLQHQVWKLVTLLKTLVHLHLKLQSQKLCGTLPQLVVKAEIIAALQYALQNIPYSCADALQECYKQQFPDSAITACFTWIKKDVMYGGIWPRPILPTGNSERNNSREFILHSTL